MNVLTVDEYLRVTTTMSDSPVVMLVGVTDDVYDNKLMEMKLNSLYRSPTVKAIIPFNCSSKISSMYSRFGEFTEESQQAASSEKHQRCSSRSMGQEVQRRLVVSCVSAYRHFH